MISAKAVSYTEGYRSGHNEAVLKTVWAHAHKGSNPFPSAISPDFSGLFSKKYILEDNNERNYVFRCVVSATHLLVLENNMNYNYSQTPNYRHNKSKDKKILLFAIVFFIFAIVFSVGMTLLHKDVKNYFNIPFKYDDLEITVTSVEETDCENGSFSAKVTFFVKNISDKTNTFDLDDVYLKNETTKQDYTKTKLFSHENLKAGESKEYSMEFTIPSSISSEKYLLCFDFADTEAKCALYHENGELLKVLILLGFQRL